MFCAFFAANLPGTLLGEYFADLLIGNEVIVELKATRAVADEQVAHLLGYLKSSRKEHGLLISFGSYKFYITKYVRTEQRGVASSQQEPKEWM